MTFSIFSPLTFFEIEIFYRWASLGFLFFSGLIVGEILWKKKSSLLLSFFRRGIQIFALFLAVNIVSFLSQYSFDDWQIFSVEIVRGDEGLVANLLLPLSGFFLILPVLRFLPSFLGFFWSLLGFVLLDLLALEKGIFFLNALFLLTVVLGFFTGRLFSIEKIRLFLHKKSVLLPFILLYIAVGVLIGTGIWRDSFFSFFSVFWSFHLLLFLLFYFSIPSLLFSGFQKKTALRQFFETIGVEVLFVYIFSAVLLKIIAFFVPTLLGVYPFILAFHLVILSFATVVILRKIFQKSKRFKKCFRFIF